MTTPNNQDPEDDDEGFEARLEAIMEQAYARADVAYDRFYRRMIKEDEDTRSPIVFTTWCNLTHLLVCDYHTLDGLIKTLKQEYQIGLDGRNAFDEEDRLKAINSTKPYEVH